MSQALFRQQPVNRFKVLRLCPENPGGCGCSLHLLKQRAAPGTALEGPVYHRTYPTPVP